jgi:hypothetical protein
MIGARRMNAALKPVCPDSMMVYPSAPPFSLLLWNFVLEGFTGFSTTSLRIWTYLSGSVSQLLLSFVIYIAVKVLISGAVVLGYASQIIAVIFLVGLQLIGTGIIREYLGRTCMEAKRRSVYIVCWMYGVGK